MTASESVSSQNQIQWSINCDNFWARDPCQDLSNSVRPYPGFFWPYCTVPFSTAFCSGRTHTRMAVRRTFSILPILSDSTHFIVYVNLNQHICTLLLGKWLAKHGFFRTLFKLENVIQNPRNPMCKTQKITKKKWNTKIVQRTANIFGRTCTHTAIPQNCHTVQYGRTLLLICGTIVCVPFKNLNSKLPAKLLNLCNKLDSGQWHGPPFAFLCPYWLNFVGRKLNNFFFVLRCCFWQFVGLCTG